MDDKPIVRLLFRPVEAAEALGCSRAKAYELIASGTIPSVRLGNSVRVPVDELRAWVKRQIHEGKTAVPKTKAG